MIQTLYSCDSFKMNENLNKTCTKHNKRCVLFDTNYCTCFDDKNEIKDNNSAPRE